MREPSSSTTPSASAAARGARTLSRPSSLAAATSSTVGRASADAKSSASIVSAGKPGQTPAEQLVQALGDAQRLARRWPCIGALELATELERKERVTRRGLENAGELRPGQLEPEAIPEQMVERAETQWPDPEPLEPLVGEGALELEGSRDLGNLPQRRQQADALLAETSQRDLEHACRRRVEPLDVVERSDDRAALGEKAKHIEQGESDRARIGSLLARLGEEKCDLERATTRWGERGRHLVEDRRQEVGETREGEQRLGLDASMGEDAAEALSGLLDTRLPEDRLADAGLAGEDEGRRPLLDLSEKRLDRAKLLVAPNDCRCGHSPGIVMRRTGRRRARRRCLLPTPRSVPGTERGGLGTKVDASPHESARFRLRTPGFTETFCGFPSQFAAIRDSIAARGARVGRCQARCQAPKHSARLAIVAVSGSERRERAMARRGKVIVSCAVTGSIHVPSPTPASADHACARSRRARSGRLRPGPRSSTCTHAIRRPAARRRTRPSSPSSSPRSGRTAMP